MASLKSGWNRFTSFLGFGPKGTEKTDQVETSQSNDCPSEIEAHSKPLADAVKENSTLLKSQQSDLPIYKIPLKQNVINVSGCRSFSFGKESCKHNRTIMVLGATGAGKSTLINGMINYILGVEWKDKYRFKLVEEIQSASQAHSQTSEVTVYKIHHQEDFKIPFSLTIVDTPGFGDTRGIERDREIVEQLRRLFSAQLGVTEIDAVCFVAQAALARLTPTQKYVFDSVLSIFGKDVAENIRILVTFADGQRPPVLEAINAAGVPCPKTKDGLPAHFKFNNSALFANNKSPEAESGNDDDEEGSFDKMFWEMGTKSMKRFFDALNVIETKSLTLTKEVLRERKQLENSVENLQVQVKLGLAKLEEIKETSEKLKEHEAEISRNENFEFEVTVTKPFAKNISGSNTYITNCQQCHVTCHYPCCISDDAKKRGCVAIGSNGYCNQCPGKCYWNVHFNQKYKWEYKEVKEKRTIKELEEKYQTATGHKMTFQGILDKLNADYHSLQAEVMKLMASSAKCLNRLKEIALKPNPLSTPEYIDMLIEGEKHEGKPGWKERVQALIKMKEKAETMAKVEKGEELLQCTKTDLQQQNTKTNNSHQEIENQDEAETNKQDPNELAKNTDHSEIQTNEAQDEAETDSNQDQNKVNINADYDKAKTIVDQDETENNSDEVDSDGVQEKAETNKQDPNEVSTITDHSEIQTNEVQDETEINSNKSDSDAVQDEAETDSNQDQNKVSINADYDKAKTIVDQDETENNSDESDSDD